MPTTAVITPTFKNGEISGQLDYRSMSVTNLFSKIWRGPVLENILITPRLWDNLLHPKFDLTQDFSTKCNSFLIDWIQHKIRNGNVVLAVSLDSSKTSASMSHQKLLEKLKALDFFSLGNTNHWKFLKWSLIFCGWSCVCLYGDEARCSSGKNIGLPFFNWCANDLSVNISNNEHIIQHDDHCLLIWI